MSGIPGPAGRPDRTGAGILTPVALVGRRWRTIQSMRDVLAATPDLIVVAEVGNLRTAATSVFSYHPEVLVAEAGNSVTDALAVTMLATRNGGPRQPAILIVLETGQDPADLVLPFGARGLVFERDLQELLPMAVRLLARGYLVVPQSMRKSVLQGAVGHSVESVDRSALKKLTPREIEVFRLVGQGHDNREISTRLQLSQATVKSYLQRILGKLNLRSRVDIVIVAHDLELV